MIFKNNFSYSIDKDSIHYTITNNITNEVICGVKTDEYETVDEQISEYINTYVKMINSQIPIDELKQEYIKYSKELLEEHLLNNPLKSSVHNGEEKYYSITSEKQILLTKEILICQAYKDNENEYQPSWNATGEANTYDWTLTELMQLAYEITLTVKPKVLKQQAIEAAIKNCITYDDILNIDISYN